MRFTSIISTLALVVFSIVNAKAQTDSIQVESAKKAWYIPFQYAGSTGRFSAGVGFKSGKINLKSDFRIGASDFGTEFLIISPSIRSVWTPYELKPYKGFVWSPISLGVMVSAHISNNIHIAWQDYYPNGYYWWSRSLRIHPVFQTSVSTMMFDKSNLVDFYLEANTNDLYIFSYFPNMHSLSPLSIIKLGWGFRFYL